MSDAVGLPQRTCLRSLCDLAHKLRGQMVVSPRMAIDYAEELVRTGKFTPEEAELVERYKKAVKEFDNVNTDMFFLGKKYGGDEL